MARHWTNGLHQVVWKAYGKTLDKWVAQVVWKAYGKTLDTASFAHELQRTSTIPV